MSAFSSVLCADLHVLNFLISLWTSSTITSLKWKWELSFAFLMATILGWFLYFSIGLSVGLECQLRD